MQIVTTSAIKFTLTCVGLLFTFFSASATHTRSGEITYITDPANPSTIHVRLITYTDFSVTEPDHYFITISFGDGTTQELERKSRRIVVKNSIYRNIYETTHTYSGPGTYNITHKEQNRPVGIVNITKSEDQAYVTTTQVKIDPFLVNKNSANFLTYPLLEVPLGASITHHLGAYDPDGDSLSFELVPALRDLGQNTIGYYIPGFMKMNKQTGEITWDNPQVAGQYSFAAKVSEYRNNILVGYVLRDFTVLVRDFTNTFNQSLAITNRAEIGISPQHKIQVAPNQSVKINALLTDNEADSIRLSVYSDLFEKGNDLTVIQSKIGNAASAELNFVAESTLKRDMPYLIILRGQSFKGVEIYNQEIGIQVFVNSETTTDINNPTETQKVLVYPNPAEEYIVIQHPNLKKNSRLLVYDDIGKLVWSQKITANTTNIRRSQVVRSGKFIYTITENQQITKTGQFIFR